MIDETATAPGDLDQSVQLFPQITLQLATDFIDDVGGPKLFTSHNRKNIAIAAARVLSERPYLLRGCADRWGFLLGCAQKNVPGLRDAILDVCKGEVINNPFFGKIWPFRINLPKEAILLPHIVNMLVQSEYRNSTIWFREWIKRDTVKATIEDFVPNPDGLLKVVWGKSFESRTRAGACVAALLHSKTSHEGRLACEDAAVSLHDTESGAWYLRAVGAALRHATGTVGVRSAGIVAKLLDQNRKNYEARAGLDPLLNDWRQISTAPVQRDANPDLWS